MKAYFSAPDTVKYQACDVFPLLLSPQNICHAQKRLIK